MPTSTPVTPASAASSVDAAPIGILMLETHFERVHGDLGHAPTWPFPVLYRVVRGASAQRVVMEPVADLLPAFVNAARELVQQGAAAIATSCGFLALFQRDLAAAVRVPVATSALLQVAPVQALLPPGQRVGVITIHAATLTHAHLQAVGAPTDTPVVGVEPGGELFRVLVRAEKNELDRRRAEHDVLAAGRALRAQHPDVGAIVLECTNMPPYAAALQAALGVPVYDVYSLITWLHTGLRPRVFGTTLPAGSRPGPVLQASVPEASISTWFGSHENDASGAVK